MMTSEPILDVLRGISSVASFSIVANQVKHVWTEIFTGTCEHCHGAGIVICPRCSGTKDRRSRPAGISLQHVGFTDRRDYHHPCIHCGPNGQNDFVEEEPDDEDRAWAVRDDLQLAMTNRPRKSPVSILAGTVACPECKAHPRYRRHTPNFVDFFGLQSSWHQKVAERAATFYVGRENRPASRQRQMMEWSGRPLPKASVLEQLRPPPEMDFPPSDDEAGKKDEPQSEIMTGYDQLTRDDFILDYVDDGATDVDEDIEIGGRSSSGNRVRRRRRR